MPTESKDRERVKALVARAAEAAGGQNELARRTGYDKGEVSSWANGTRSCPPKAQVVMADIAGMDAVEVLALATVETEPNQARKEVLLRALGKRFDRLGAGALRALCGALGLAALLDPATLVDTMRRRVNPS